MPVPQDKAIQAAMAPARDPQIAVQEEFDAAARAGTLEAWDLFLARHPDNPLADRARAARAAIVASKRGG
jgi:hypothetical protein